LPGICVDFDREKHKLSISLVDVNKIGQSSLFDKTLFRLRIWSVKAKSARNPKERKEAIGDLHRLDLQTISSDYVELWKTKVVSLNQLHTTYLIEVRRRLFVN
jgi:hypothetical protein